MAQHRVILSQRSYTLLNSLQVNTHFLSHRLLTCKIMRNKLMQRRVQQTDIHRQAIHCLKNTLKVSLLIRKKFCQCLLTSLSICCKDHFTHSDNLLIIEEHMFRTSKTNTLGTEGTSNLCIMWSIRICTNLKFCILITKIHQFLEITTKFCSLSLNLTLIYLTRRTIQGNIVTFVEYLTINLYSLTLIININATST